MNKAFRHVETLFVQDNQVRTDPNKPHFLLIKMEVCFDQYELDYLGRIMFLHVEMPNCSEIFIYIFLYIYIHMYHVYSYINIYKIFCFNKIIRNFKCQPLTKTSQAVDNKCSS